MRKGGGRLGARRPGVRPLEYTDGGQEVARRWGCQATSGAVAGGITNNPISPDTGRDWRRKPGISRDSPP